MDGGMFFIVIAIFIVFWVAMWLGVTKLISVLGWSKYVDDRQMQTEPPADAQHFSGQTLTIGGGILFPINYSNVMNGWVHQSGVYLQPIWMFRMFHPMLHFRWDEIQSVEQVATFILKRFKISVRRHRRPLVIYGKLGNAVFNSWAERQTSSAGSAL